MIELIIENWAQITVLLGIISYIIKLFLEYEFKKKEISFLKVQEMKLAETKLFFQSYQSFRISLEQFINQIFFGSHSEKIFENIRKEIKNCHIDFEYKCMTLKLFLKDEDIRTIDKVSESLKIIKAEIEKALIYQDKNVNSKHWDNLKKIKNEKFKKELPLLIKKIETSLRKSYNIV